MIEFKSKFTREILEIDEIFKEKDYGSKESEILINHLLIYIYTTYEQEVKKIIQKTYHYMSNYNYFSPVLSSVSVHQNNWIPKLKRANLESYFPILKEWDFWKESNYIYTESLVSERHKYAHTGSHSITYDQILRSFIEITYVLNFLSHIYDLEHAQKDIVFEYIQNHSEDKNIIEQTLKKSMEGLIENERDFIPDKLKSYCLDTISSIENNYILSKSLSEEFKEFLGIDNLNKITLSEKSKENPKELLEFFNNYIEMTKGSYPNLSHGNDRHIIERVRQAAEF